MRWVLYALAVLSTLVVPWWVVVPLNVVVATLPWGGIAAALSGVLLDSIYGGGYLYTIIFVAIALSVEFLSTRVMDYDA